MTVPGRAKRSATVVRELFKNKAYDELRSRFDNLRYPSGTILSERQLAEELGMSKTPIKAALERLEMEGFITVSPQSGIVVRGLTLTELTEMYQVRIALEGFVLRKMAGKLTAEQIVQLESNLDSYAALEGVPEARLDAVRLDAEFHQLPSLFLGNSLIINTLQQYSVRIVQFINRVFAHLPSRVGQSLVEHRQIADALKSGQGSRASELSENHLRLGLQVLFDVLEKTDGRSADSTD